MSNAEAIARTRQQEDGYDSYNFDRWEISPVKEKAVIKLRGVIAVYKPRKEVG